MKTKHMQISVFGALRNWRSGEQWEGVCTDENGQEQTLEQVQQWLKEHEAKGHKVVPACHEHECPDFDYSGGGCPGHIVTSMLGVKLIKAERQRQLDKEGWTPEHDDGHNKGELAISAGCYALLDEARRNHAVAGFVRGLWPFGSCYFKPTVADRVRELTKAGALIAAEIDRLERIAEVKAPVANEVDAETLRTAWSDPANWSQAVKVLTVDDNAPYSEQDIPLAMAIVNRICETAFEEFASRHAVWGIVESACVVDARQATNDANAEYVARQLLCYGMRKVLDSAGPVPFDQEESTLTAG